MPHADQPGSVPSSGTFSAYAFLCKVVLRDRRPFARPALAATFQSPLLWLALFLPEPAAGFGDWVLLLLIGAVPAVLGWLLALRGVFALLALGGIIGLAFWLFMLPQIVFGVLTQGLLDVCRTDPIGWCAISAQLLFYPWGWWVVYRFATENTAMLSAPLRRDRMQDHDGAGP